MDSWRPIETAPFEIIDGCRWLGWVLFGKFDEHGFVEWVGSMDSEIWLARQPDRACDDTDFAPTHWMPLPTPPQFKDKP